MKLSIIIPCFNESLYLARCINSLLENDFPHNELEILIVDGGSTDGTIDIIKGYMEKFSFITLIHNRKRLKPIALNMGIKAAVGDVIMRIDAHAIYDKNYMSELVQGLYSEGVDNIGGIRDTYIPNEGSAMEITLSEAISHPIVVGGAYYRTGAISEKKLVDTVFCGCYRKEIFNKIGLFNEKLIRTQDREFNTRLIESGGKIMLDPNVRCTYYPRTKFLEYLKWNWKGAEWLGYAKRFTDCNMLSSRNYIPILFSLYVVSIVFIGLYFLVQDVSFVFLLIALLPLMLYFILVSKAGIGLFKRHKRFGVLVLFPLVAFLTHVLYGVAFLWGRMRALLSRNKD